MERVNFYVDGYNFYNGLRRLKKVDAVWQKFYWLDFVKFFQHFVGNSQVLQKVYYFTAPPLKIEKSDRQSKLFLANKAINSNRFEVIKGQFYEKQVTCRLCKGTYSIAEVKRTDVNISVRMMADCSTNNVDTLVLVSADSDFMPPLQFIRENYPDKKIRVYFPPDLNSGALSAFMRADNKKVVRLENSKVKFQNSIMPDIVSVGDFSCTIPPKWKV